MPVKKKPSAKQIAARKKFAAIMKSGGFPKRNRANNKVKKRITAKTRKLQSQINKFKKPTQAQLKKQEAIKRRNRKRLGLGSSSNIDNSLLLEFKEALKNPKIKEIRFVK
jgi:hypothetical protein